MSNGVVAPVANGTATITAKTTDGTNKSADCTVTVKTSLTGVTVSPNTTQTIYTNATPKSFAITPTNNPTTASIASVSWTSDNSGVATVSNGTVSAVANGNCTITYSATDAFGNTKTATCPVNVQTKVTGISHNLVDVTLNMNESGRTFTASVQPDNATNKKIIWSSSNPSKVSVDQNGNVKALENSGSATITAKTEDGGYSASCTVTCYVPVTSVSLSQPQGIKIIEGSNTGHRSHSVTLTATVSPLNATNKNVSWKSSSSSASVSSGTVTGGDAGNATITVTTEDGGKTASYDITVTNYNSKSYVDFGLPSGNVWRTCNVGAGNSGECGWFITPGETGFRGATAPFDFQYLRNNGLWGGGEASGRVPDGWNPPSSSYSARDAEYFSNGVLKPDYDVAHKHENGSWRMPTTAEYMELVDGTDHYWTTYNDIPGMMFKGRGSYSTQTMFIPAWGNIDGVTFEERGNQGWNLTFGYYWAADSSGAWAKVFAFFDSSWGELAMKLQISYCPVAYGCLVRAVSK